MRSSRSISSGLIVLSLVSFSLETLPDLTESQRTTLRWVEIVTVAAFTIEYALRLSVADRKLSFVFSFFGLIDLAAILPFYVATGLDLRSLRAVRLIRLSGDARGEEPLPTTEPPGPAT